jgi:hypothetical protein
MLSRKGSVTKNEYQHNVHFGANVDPTASDPSWPLRLTQAIERTGQEQIGIQDHPYNAEFRDAWTLIATLLQAMKRVHFLPNVTNLPWALPPCWPEPQRRWMCEASGGSSLAWTLFVRVSRPWVGRDASYRESIDALEEAVQIKPRHDSL